STPEPVPVVCEESVDRKTLRLRFVTEPPQVFVLPQEKVIWGFDAAYQKGQTLFTVKYTPAINPKQPLSGIRILLDPGHHPDTGALGPRGTEERAANLAMCQALAPLLKNEGAVVELSRENDPLELNDRQKRFHDAKPDLIVSIHHNSSPDNEDPRVRFGTQDFYLFPHSQPLAKSVHRALLPVVQSQDLGSVQRNLVVTRFPCAPSILVEVTYLIIPEEEKKVLTAEYRQQAAEAISDGIQKFLLGESGPKR
ncbi:MAG: N-acetylmuramoyl-L-alanine amidase, partial [Verrucomicrobiae bacterium]|nr:N-acetylmuramoyl-L-alanine amidase [Verrucomicrobiae bacterium]